MDKIRELVNKQAEDEGLWFIAETASEAYLQQHLRRLHSLIESIIPDETNNETKGETNE